VPDSRVQLDDGDTPGAVICSPAVGLTRDGAGQLCSVHHGCRRCFLFLAAGESEALLALVLDGANGRKESVGVCEGWNHRGKLI
jgi:hypothetical protein